MSPPAPERAERITRDAPITPRVARDSRRANHPAPSLPFNLRLCTLAASDWGTESGWVRRTSRSRTENEDVLTHSQALLPAMTLRPGFRPQPQSDRWSEERGGVKGSSWPPNEKLSQISRPRLE